MKRNTLFITVSTVLIVVMLLLGACSAPQTTTVPPTALAGAVPTSSAGYPVPAAASPTAAPVGGQSAYPNPEAAGVQIQVTNPNGGSFTLGEDVLKNMGLTQIQAGGQTENGVKLSDLLTQINITDYTQVVITGSSGSLTLTKDQVTPDVLLTFPGQGSANLVSSALPADQWVTGVNKIEAK